MALRQQSVDGTLTPNSIRMIRQELAFGGKITREDAMAMATRLLETLAEVSRVRSALAGWEQAQLEAAADAYDEGFHDGAEGHEHRNARAVLAEIAGADT